MNRDVLHKSLPRFPQPATKPFAVPTTSLVNIRLVQYWHMTKVPPAKPMNVRRMQSPRAVWISPVQAAGIDAAHKTIENNTRAPYLSQSGPTINRIIIVPPTPAIDEFQISCLVKPRDAWISGKSGEIANQIKNAMKKAHLFGKPNQFRRKWTQKETNRERQLSATAISCGSWQSSTKSTMLNGMTYQEQWNARIWGLITLHSCISFDLSSWFGSTSTS